MNASPTRDRRHVALPAFGLTMATMLTLSACTLLADFPDYTAPNVCGDDLAGAGEQCDGVDLREQSCETAHHYPGTLVCDNTCQFNYSGCGGSCGDGARQANWESCDGSDFGDASCSSEVAGSTGGALACNSDCDIEASGCFLCGDDVRDPGEDCDGSDRNGWDCENFGLGNGQLGCTDQCAWDLTHCGSCGDSICMPASGETAVDCHVDCRWTTVAAGAIATCGLRVHGSLWCWGSGAGVGPLMQHFNPVLMSDNMSFEQLVAGREHFCALTAAGEVYCWGVGLLGQLGTGFDSDEVEPTLVQLVGRHVVALGAGQDHSCAVIDNGTVECWGSNIDGCLGAGDNANTLPHSNLPMLVLGVNDASAVAAGYSHTCALRGGGGVQCWGQGANGQLGNGGVSLSLDPVDASNIAQATALTAGSNFTCVLESSGLVRCWGANDKGQLGDGTNSMALTPVDATNLPMGGMVHIDAGWDHLCAAGADTVAYCWGDGYLGRLGRVLIPSSCTAHQPEQPIAPVIKIGAGETVDVIQVSAGRDHSCAVLSTGYAQCWGYGVDGQLGIGQPLIPCHPEAEDVLDR